MMQVDVVKWNKKLAHLRIKDSGLTLCGISIPDNLLDKSDWLGDIVVCQACKIARASKQYDDLETKGL